MSSSMSQPILKQFEKEVMKESQAEEERIKQAMKELSALQKESEKLHKAVLKSETDVEKSKRKEASAIAALHKADHDRDVAAADVKTAEKEFEHFREKEKSMHQQLDQKKAQIESAIKEQHAHNEARQAKLAELRHCGCSQTQPSGFITTPSTVGALPGGMGTSEGRRTSGEYTSVNVPIATMPYPTLVVPQTTGSLSSGSSELPGHPTKVGEGTGSTHTGGQKADAAQGGKSGGWE